MTFVPTAFANNEVPKPSMHEHDHERGDKNETSCPPQKDLKECKEIVEKRLHACLENVNMGLDKRDKKSKNREAIEKCKEFSKMRIEQCKETCKKEIKAH